MRSIYKLTKLFSKNEKCKYILLILLSLVSTFLELFSIAMLIPLLASISGEKSFISDFISNIGLPVDLIKYLDFGNILILIMVLFFLKFFFLLTISYFRNNFIFDFQQRLVNELFEKYLKKNYLFHISNNSAKILKNITEEVHHLSIGYMGSLTSIILDCIMIFALLTFLLFVQIKTTFIVIIFSGIIIYIIYRNLKNKITNLGELREKYNFIHLKNILQAFEGIKEIKIFQKEAEISKNFSNNSKNIKHLNWLLMFLNETPRIFFELISIMSFLAILLFLVKLEYLFIEIISYFTIILAVYIKLMPSINRFVVSYINITLNTKSLNVIFEELSEKKSVLTNESEIKKKIYFKNKIVIKNLTFYYENNKHKIFDKLNLEIRKGEFVALVGITGSGKTTLIDLIAGLLSPNEGEILSDNRNIESNKSDWLNKVGYVPQNIFLYDDSIEKNIAFTTNEKKVNRNKVIEAAKQSQIYEFITSKKDKLDTIVGERGARLSGGQKQRIGIARALYNNSEILIFDEFTSALDIHTEEKVLQELAKFKNKKTIIISTHKSNILKHCDRVFDVKKKKFINKI
jgi:ABC-type multidrug transport system fused ATPase/permease subunit